MAACLHCHAALDSPRKFYCDDRCRARAYRRRRVGLPPDAFRDGLRGSAPLGVLTRAEERDWLRADLLTIRRRAA